MNAPDWFYQVTPIFHITNINNLNSIINANGILCKNEVNKRKLAYDNIANNQIQQNRNSALMQNGKSLHDYVPFSFAPLTPMLNSLHKGKVPNCTTSQNDVVYLVTHAQSVAMNNSMSILFTDVHPLSAPVQRFTNIRELDKIDWEVFFEDPRITGDYAKYWLDKSDRIDKPKWADRRRKRMAEFLVLNSLPLLFIKHFVVIDQAAQDRVMKILEMHKINKEVKIIRDWYY